MPKAKVSEDVENAIVQADPGLELEMISRKLEKSEDETEIEELIGRRRALRREQRKRRLQREMQDIEDGLDEDVFY